MIDHDRAHYARMAFDAIDAFETLATQESVIARMSAILSNFGFTSFLVVSTRPTTVGKPVPRFHMNGWPLAWSEEYLRRKYFTEDPIAMHTLQAVDPFEWRDVCYSDERFPRGREVMNTAGECGLKQGMVIPIVRNDVVAAVTMAGEQPEFDANARRAIHLVGLFAHEKAMALESQTGPPRRVLTDRERDVVAWVAAGKTAWDISIILGVSEAAVVKRINNAMRKLDASNRAQAVAHAIRAKEIII